MRAWTARFLLDFIEIRSQRLKLPRLKEQRLNDCRVLERRIATQVHTALAMHRFMLFLLPQAEAGSSGQRLQVLRFRTEYADTGVTKFGQRSPKAAANTANTQRIRCGLA